MSRTFVSAALLFSCLALPRFALAQPDVKGEWGPVLNWPLVAIHMVHLPTGKILMWGRAPLGDTPVIYNPANETFLPMNSDGTDVFCAGHNFLSDGQVLVAGGHVADHVGLSDALLFNPFKGPNGAWKRLPNMAYPRWYPTLTANERGEILIVSGDMYVDANTAVPVQARTPEFFDPQTRTIKTLHLATKTIPIYPYIFLQPDGNYVAIGRVWKYLRLNSTTWKWYTSIPDGPLLGGSAVQYLPGKMLKTGGTANYGVREGVNKAAQLDTTGVQPPAIREVAPMGYARVDHDMTMLPDGKVLVTGGSSLSRKLYSAILPAEMWDPATETWTEMAAMTQGRSYHSSALLMPDGRVLVAGSGTGGKTRFSPDNFDQLSAQYYYPPYLFKGPRPVVTDTPGLIAYRGSFTIKTPDAASIQKVSLVRLGAVTHAIDMAQNFLPLEFTVGAGQLTVTAPSSGRIGQPGYYMLFIVNSNGVPSVGKYVLLSERMPFKAPLALQQDTPEPLDISKVASRDDVFLSLPTTESAPRSLIVEGPGQLKHISSATVEIRSSWVTGGQLRIELFDFEENAWVVARDVKTSTTMSILKGELTGYASRFINPETNNLMVRFTWSKGGSGANGQVLIDQVRFSVTR